MPQIIYGGLGGSEVSGLRSCRLGVRRKVLCDGGGISVSVTALWCYVTDMIEDLCPVLLISVTGKECEFSFDLIIALTL